VSLVALAEVLRDAGDAGARVLDVQWATAHLRTLGAVAVPRTRYVEMVHRATALPLPAAFGSGPVTSRG
jgi:leucyl/phenylalanyl-tRNA--protein transferase